MADERVFPDVDFVETDTNTIVQETVDSYEENFGRTLATADPMRMLILWLCSIISHERSYINIAAKRNLPRYATGQYLDSLSELFFGIYRKAATPATTTLRFLVEEVLEETVVIPAGTEVTNNGTIVFATIEDAEITPGTLYVDVDAECTEEGTIGNDYDVGSLSNMIEPIPYIDQVKNITVTEGGTDEETDDELYNRGRESYEGYSTAGTIGAYTYHIKDHNPSVADVVVRELNPGQVGITLLMDNGIPSQNVINDMQEYISSDEIRPLTDQVIVSAPTAVNFSVELTYYAAARPAIGGEELANAVSQAVQKYIDWQTGKLGRRINPGKLIAYVIQAGAERVDIVSPAARELSATECAVLTGTPALNYGGEDE